MRSIDRAIPGPRFHPARTPVHQHNEASTDGEASRPHHRSMRPFHGFTLPLSGAALTYGDRRSRACSGRQGSTGALAPRPLSPGGEG
jgi:hypothetical protein